MEKYYLIIIYLSKTRPILDAFLHPLVGLVPYIHSLDSLI